MFTQRDYQTIRYQLLSVRYFWANNYTVRKKGGGGLADAAIEAHKRILQMQIFSRLWNNTVESTRYHSRNTTNTACAIQLFCTDTNDTVRWQLQNAALLKLSNFETPLDDSPPKSSHGFPTFLQQWFTRMFGKYNSFLIPFVNLCAPKHASI